MNRNMRNWMYVLFAILIMCITLGYAYLNTELNINGTTNITSANWSVYWDNVQFGSNNVTDITTPATIQPGLTEVVFNVNFAAPGDTYEFTVDAVNDGSIDAMISNISNGVYAANGITPKNLPDYLEYTVTYSDGVAIAQNHILAAGTTETYKVKVYFKDSTTASQLPSTSDNYMFKFGMSYVQKTSSGIIKPLPTFTLSCSQGEYSFNNGMTFGDWIKSDLYPGNISGDFSSLEDCQQVWGNNKGCALSNAETVYSHPSVTNYLTTSQSECESHDNCTTLNNSVYQNIYEELFPSLNECTDYYEPEECSLLPVAYQYSITDYYNYATQSECEDEQGVGNCIQRTINHYSPIYRAGTISDGEFEFTPYSAAFFPENLDDIFKVFSYDETLTNSTYNCYRIAECVSPESEILSSNNKTIKAKNIKENDDIAYFDFNTNKMEIGKVKKVFIHKDASSFVKYILEDNTYIEATDYHPIYTSSGWKSYTNRNGYPKPKIGDLVKTNDGYKKLKKIETFKGKEDYYDFQIISKNGKTINNYYANGILVQGSY